MFVSFTMMDRSRATKPLKIMLLAGLLRTMIVVKFSMTAEDEVTSLAYTGVRRYRTVIISILVGTSICLPYLHLLPLQQCMVYRGPNST
jgi:hypothetical protein